MTRSRVGSKEPESEQREEPKLAVFQVNHPSQSLTSRTVCSPSAGPQLAKCQQGENREIENDPLETTLQ